MADMYGKGAKGKATRLHSQLVRMRGLCESCGSTENLQCAHIMSRSYNATRTDENNAFCLCARCHWFYTKAPIEFARFTFERIGEPAYDALRLKALVGVRWHESDWQDECARLQGLIAVSLASGATQA
jgi:hypothetical protein